MSDAEKLNKVVALLAAREKVELIVPAADAGFKRAEVLNLLMSKINDPFLVAAAMGNLTVHAREDLAHLEDAK